MPDFQQNVINLIRGTTPLFRAGGPALDVSLFTADDLPYASIMVPRHNNRAKSAYFQRNNRELTQLVKELIPGCRVDEYKYFAEEDYEEEDAEATGRGVCIFEYDADADGNGNGDWRLWQEVKLQRGRALGQEVIPSN